MLSVGRVSVTYVILIPFLSGPKIWSFLTLFPSKSLVANPFDNSPHALLGTDFAFSTSNLPTCLR